MYSETIADGKVRCLKWSDKRVVNMLSTFHSDDVKQRHTRAVVGGTEIIKKPVMIYQYNQHMGGVDLNDQMILHYGYSHR